MHLRGLTKIGATCAVILFLCGIIYGCPAFCTQCWSSDKTVPIAYGLISLDFSTDYERGGCRRKSDNWYCRRCHRKSWWWTSKH